MTGPHPRTFGSKYSGFRPDYPRDGSMDYGAHPFHQKFMEAYREGVSQAKVGFADQWRRPRFFQMLQMLKLTRGLKGKTAEAGCFRGLSSYLICRTEQWENAKFQGEDHFIVDSFEGLSRPGKEDGEGSKQRHAQGMFTRTSPAHVKQTLKEFPKVEIVKGWIPEGLSQLPDQEYRFVHIDVDLCRPTLDSLEYFYPKLVPGGVIVVDDYGPHPRGDWPGCGKAVRGFAEAEGVPFAALDTGNAVFVKRP